MHAGLQGPCKPESMLVIMEIIKAANTIAESLDAVVFIYSGPIDDIGFGCLIESMQPSDDQPKRQNAILFLTTYGGNAESAYRIARLLQTITEKFYLCISLKM